MTKPSFLSASALCGILVLVAPDARADGFFFQLDRTTSTTDAVVAGTRGAFSFGLNRADYDGGWSAGAFVSRDFVLDGVGTLKVGPSIGTSDGDAGVDWGARVVAERYQPTDFGFVFVSAQYDTIDSSWFSVAEFGGTDGLSISVTAGGSDTYSDQTVSLNRKVGDGPFTVRTGYRFESEALFVGLSVNTY
ncbi:hypothetical protein [Salipiger pallidus]|nr:hypothetical protein [Salipiger pallidus]